MPCWFTSVISRCMTGWQAHQSFIVVSNGDPACAETIIDGNERVVRARLYDAKFFLRRRLEAAS